MAYKVFISHSSHDTWVAKQLKKYTEEAGATVFLDSDSIEAGDDFEDEILDNLRESSEFIVLLTPAAMESDYVKREIGAAWGLRIRIVAVLYGVALDQPHRLIRGTNLHIQINDVDDYFRQLSERIKKQSQ